MSRVALVLIALVLAAAGTAPPLPVWPESYRVDGVFALYPIGLAPVLFQNISIYYDTNLGGRQDYDNGLQTIVQSIQDGLTYTVWVAKDHQACTVSNSSGPTHYAQLSAAGGDAMAIQPGLPDMADFGFGGITACPESNGGCYRWTKTEIINGKINNYAIWTRVTTGEPVVFTFLGYDELFGSHFDYYSFSYTRFIPNFSSPDLIRKPDICQSPVEQANDHLHGLALHNALPAQNHRMFRQFARDHKKEYAHKKEYDSRLTTFTQTLAFLKTHNAKADAFKVAVNHLADRTEDELKALRGFRSNGKQNKADTYHKVTAEAPAAIDWREKGVVTFVKDQGICGSCWSFSTTGALEGQFILRRGVQVALSQQFLVDCAWNGNFGCGGGMQNLAYDYIIEHGGIPQEGDYGPYRMINDYCREAQVPIAASISGYVNITFGDEEALKNAVATIGPMAVSIDASHKAFSYYSSGVYFEPSCKSDLDDLDHAVLVVGYGTDNGQDYWIVKNSWSTFWGDQGYAKMARNRNNNCGIASGALYPLLA